MLVLLENSLFCSALALFNVLMKKNYYCVEENRCTANNYHFHIMQ